METIARILVEYWYWFASALFVFCVLLSLSLKKSDNKAVKLKSRFTDKIISASLYSGAHKSPIRVFPDVSRIVMYNNQLHIYHQDTKSLVVLGASDYLMASGNPTTCTKAEATSVALYFEGELLFEDLLYDFGTTENNVLAGYEADGADAYVAFGKGLTLLAKKI